MSSISLSGRCAVIALLLSVAFASNAIAQQSPYGQNRPYQPVAAQQNQYQNQQAAIEPQGQYPPQGAVSQTPQSHQRVPYRVADRTTQQSVKFDFAKRPNEHPLAPAIRWAHSGLVDIKNMNDYSARVVKRERINGKVGDYEHMFVKVRHHPFSVYMCFLGPSDLRGQEVIYVNGQNDGKMWAHGTGLKHTMFGTVSIKPNGPLAMVGQRYPITELGVQNLVQRLIEIGTRDMQYGECEVQFFENAKIENRTCTCIQVMHPVPRRNFLFHQARIFVDNELNLPIRYAAYDWPKKPGGSPELIEEYTYLDMKVNNGFTDADFDIRNPNYNFTKK